MAVFVILVLLGAVVTNYVSVGDVDISAELNGNNETVIEIGTELPDTFMYAVYSDTVENDCIYFYLDDKYQAIMEYQSQKDAFNALEIMLKDRGVGETIYVDAEELVSVMKDPSSKIIFLSGVLPDTVFESNEGSIAEKWFSQGGTAYWLGPEIGTLRSTYKELEETDISFVDSRYVHQLIDDQDEYGDYCSTDSLALSLSYECSTFGLSEDYPGSKVLGRVSPNGYSTISVIGDVFENGRLYVFGGFLDKVSIKFVTSISDVIASGVTEDSILKGYGKFSKMYGAYEYNTKIVAEDGDSVYVMRGSPMSSGGNYVVL